MRRDAIVHIFRPDVRQFYNLEKMWSADRPGRSSSKKLRPMRLALVCVGKLKAGPERLLFDRYFKRLTEGARGVGFAGVDLREIDEFAGPPAGRTAGRRRRGDPGRRAEGRRAGRCSTSAGRRRPARNGRPTSAGRGTRRERLYAVAIGGPDGLDPSLAAAAASNPELRRDDLAAPARPGDGGRAALSGDNHSRRPSLSSRMSAAIFG